MITENHPFSALSRQLEQLLWASIIISTAVAAISLVNLGRLSLFMAPVLFMATTLHHGILLGLHHRDRKKSAEELKGTLAPTAHKASIIFCWILVVFWIICVLAVVIVSVLIMANNQFEGWERLAGYIEIPMEVAEIVLLIVIAVKCRTQRRSTMIEPAHVDWENYGTTNTAV
ncbi:unnamed protein product [Cyclocybe aegerita]|uniref:Transmembrane protein n=1 Tax=Cyclocybe aegerita TaxID=1973307 RepID=A0A8S0W2L3_CYCAE|nr:unnamed protein product [Cyclocybe aegerita]